MLDKKLYLQNCGWTVRSELRRRFVDSLKNGLVVTRLWGRSRSSLRPRGRLLLLGRLLLPHPGHVPLLPPPVHVHLLQVSLNGFLDRVPWSFRLWPWSESNQWELYDLKKTILIKINVFLQNQLLTMFERIIAKSRFPCCMQFEISTILDVVKK